MTGDVLDPVLALRREVTLGPGDDTLVAAVVAVTPDRDAALGLAGRYAAKEAFSKAYGTGIGKLSFQDIEILPGEYRKPEITKSPFEGKGFVSITHSGNIIAAQVVLEK